MKQLSVIVLISIETALLGLATPSKLAAQPKVGEVFDVDQSEDRVLFARKIEEDNTYADGSLHIYDIQKNMSHELLKLKHLNYLVKSYFIEGNRIMVGSKAGIEIFDIANKKYVSRVLELGKHEVIVSTSKDSSGVRFVVRDTGEKPKLTLYKLDNNSKLPSVVYRRDIELQPTDNFFDLYAVGQEILFLDNGKLFRVEKDRDILLCESVAFNPRELRYVVNVGTKSLVFVSHNDQKVNLYHAGMVQYVPILFSSVDDITVRECNMGKKLYWQITAGLNLVTVNELGARHPINEKVIYKSEKLKILNAGLHRFVVSKTK